MQETQDTRMKVMKQAKMTTKFYGTYKNTCLNKKRMKLTKLPWVSEEEFHDLASAKKTIPIFLY